MIELGKKYKADSISHLIYTCVHVGKNNSMLEADTGHSLLVPHECSWVIEYKEPVVHIKFVVWCKHRGYNEVRFIQSPSKYKNELEIQDWVRNTYPSHQVLEVVKLTYTEE